MYDYDSSQTKPNMPHVSPAAIERFLQDGSGGGIEACKNRAGIPPMAIAMHTQGRGYAFVGGGNK